MRVPRNQEGKQKAKEYEYDIASIIAIVGSFTVLVILLAGSSWRVRGPASVSYHHRAIGGLRTWYFKWRSRISALVNKLLIGVIALVAVLSLQFALYRVLERIPDGLGGDRPVIASTTVEAARAYMPLGSGLGTFVPVYAMFKSPKMRLIPM